MILLLSFAGLVVGVLIRSEIKVRRWMKAYDLHNDMLSKFNEFTEDPLMSEIKLKEWLPIFEHADEEVKRICDDREFVPIAPMLMKAIINEIGFSRSA